MTQEGLGGSLVVRRPRRVEPRGRESCVTHLTCYLGLSQSPSFLLFFSACISGAGESLSG